MPTFSGSGSAQVVGGGTLSKTYGILYVELYNINLSYASSFNEQGRGVDDLSEEKLYGENLNTLKSAIDNTKSLAEALLA